MARTVADLALAFEVLAGPSEVDQPAWRLELPTCRVPALADFRVAVMRENPICPVDGSITGAIDAITGRLRRLGATVSETARPEIDVGRAFELFWLLLRGVTSSALPDDEFEPLRRDAAALPAGDHGYRARVARAAVQSHRSWFAANEERHELRRRWAAFFEDWDVLLCPPAASPAFVHDQERPRHERRIEVDGRAQDYNTQMLWAGLFGVAYLPATVIPAGHAPSGLPVGVQIVGRYLGDLTTLAFATLLERELGGFTPPPGFD